MTNNNNGNTKSMPMGPPVPVTDRIAYQIKSRVYNGRIYYGAAVGRLFVSKKTNQSEVWHDFGEKDADDYIKGIRQAKKKLSELREAAYQHQQQAKGANSQQQTAEQQHDSQPACGNTASYPSQAPTILDASGNNWRA